MCQTHILFLLDEAFAISYTNKNEAGRSGKMIQIYKNYEGHKELEELDHNRIGIMGDDHRSNDGGTHEYFERL